MTRHEIRQQVIEKERRIRSLQAEGRTGPEIAAELGITVQRLYDFLSDARHRKPVLSPTEKLRRDERERRMIATKKIHVSGDKTRAAEAILQDLATLLLHSEFTTATVGGVVTQVQVTKAFKRPRPGRGIPSALRKLRAAIVAAKRVTLLRHREHSGDRIKWQVWTFVF